MLLPTFAISVPKNVLYFVYEKEFKKNINCVTNLTSGKMCIVFMYLGNEDANSDYSLILASNRDESFDRPSQIMAPWVEDQNILGGRDLMCSKNGTWLAISPLRKKIGVLLNIPRNQRDDAETRGKIVADYMKSDVSTNDYVNSIKDYVKKCNDFVFVSVELGKEVSVKTFSNTTDKLESWKGPCLGFGNHIPNDPLKKVEAGVQQLKDICNRLNKVHLKNELVVELIKLLKSDKKHLPDEQLESHRPNHTEELSSIFVSIPEVRYGTRAHTLVLVTKTGQVDVIEISLQEPIDLVNPKWVKNEFRYSLTLTC